MSLDHPALVDSLRKAYPVEKSDLYCRDFKSGSEKANKKAG